MTGRGEPIRVLLVDDHALVRRSLARLLGAEPGIEVVGDADSAQPAAQLAARLRPDVVLLDVNLPGLRGPAAVRLIRAAAPATRVVMLTVSEEGDDLLEALSNGACGYLLKDIQPEELVTAIRRAAQGDPPFSPAMAWRMIERLRRGEALAVSGAAPGAASPGAAPDMRTLADAHGLSAREADVLRLCAAGLSNKEIATTLHIAEDTVKKHLSHAFQKLGVSNRVQAASLVLGSGTRPE